VHWLIGSVACAVIAFWTLLHDPSLPLRESLARLDPRHLLTQSSSNGQSIISGEELQTDPHLLDTLRAISVVATTGVCHVNATLLWQRPWTFAHRPTAAQQAAYAKIIPFSHQVLFVRPGSQHHPTMPVHATLVTDATGAIHTQVPCGAHFTIVTREKGEARDHVFMHAGHRDAISADSNIAAARQRWMQTPALVIDATQCACQAAEAVSVPSALALVRGADWPANENVSELRAEHGELIAFIADQRDPTLPATHSRDLPGGGETLV
jgi:hypothetical protein